jgi:hypothetical protein
MSKTRRIVSFVVALSLTVGGFVASLYLLFFARQVPFKAATAAGFVLVFGLMWLHSDFIDATPNDDLK